MKRNRTTGKRVIASKGSIAKPDGKIRTTWQTPWNIVPQQVKYRLCDEGPEGCGECGLCAFGRWYVEHNAGRENDIIRV